MGSDSIIYLRTDGNSRISTGHLVRCLAIGSSLVSRQKKVCLLVSDKESRLLAEGFITSSSHKEKIKILQLKTARYDFLEDELEELVFLLSQSSASPASSLLLVDSYFVTPTYLDTLRKTARLAYLDDLKKFDYDVDLLINYDLLSPEEERELRRFYSSAKTLLLGGKYTPLRQQFTGHTPVFRKKAKQILITSGGSDPYRFCSSLLESIGYSIGKKENLFTESSLLFHVVIGSLFSLEEKQLLNALSCQYPSFRLHEGLTDLSPLMKECDLAVSAAGTTLSELCALGVPTICFILADNQIDFAFGFEREAAVCCIGNLYHIGVEQAVKNTLHCMQDLLANPQKRRQLQEQAQQLIDGRGCDRIADALCQL